MRPSKSSMVYNTAKGFVQNLLEDVGPVALLVDAGGGEIVDDGTPPQSHLIAAEGSVGLWEKSRVPTGSPLRSACQ